MTDWITYAILAGVLLVFFAIYLIVRRSVQGFKEGMRGDSGNRR